MCLNKLTMETHYSSSSPSSYCYLYCYVIHEQRAGISRSAYKLKKHESIEVVVQIPFLVLNARKEGLTVR